jgi:hypothetical protein
MTVPRASIQAGECYLTTNGQVAYDSTHLVLGSAFGGVLEQAMAARPLNLLRNRRSMAATLSLLAQISPWK